jgi:hypothetical protein
VVQQHDQALALLNAAHNVVQQVANHDFAVKVLGAGVGLHRRYAKQLERQLLPRPQVLDRAEEHDDGVKQRNADVLHF